MKQSVRLAVLILLGAALAVPALAQEPGAVNYKAKCVMCHGADGTGNTPVGRSMKLRSLKSAEDIKESDEQLSKEIKSGVGRMQGYAGKLTDAQIHDVVSYIRTLQR